MSAFRTTRGGRVDRARPLRFRFDGRTYEGLAGDTLASALLANAIEGRTPEELAVARDELTAWLAGSDVAPDWPGLAIFEPARAYTARHPSIRLAFEAAAEAAELAAARAPAR